MYYVNKKHLMTLEQMDEKFTLHTFAGEELGDKDDFVGKHLNGDREVVPQDVYEEEIVAVKLVKVDKDKMAKGYREMSDINSEEAKAGIYTYNEGEFQSNKAF